MNQARRSGVPTPGTDIFNLGYGIVSELLSAVGRDKF